MSDNFKRCRHGMALSTGCQQCTADRWPLDLAAQLGLEEQLAYKDAEIAVLKAEVAEWKAHGKEASAAILSLNAEGASLREKLKTLSEEIQSIDGHSGPCDSYGICALCTVKDLALLSTTKVRDNFEA